MNTDDADFIAVIAETDLIEQKLLDRNGYKGILRTLMQPRQRFKYNLRCVRNEPKHSPRNSKAISDRRSRAGTVRDLSPRAVWPECIRAGSATRGGGKPGRHHFLSQPNDCLVKTVDRRAAACE
jgi:hypothetical protein